MKTNSKYYIAVTSHGLKTNAIIEVGIRGVNKENKEIFKKFKRVTVKPWTTQSVSLEIGEIIAGGYRLYGKGISGPKFEQDMVVNYNTQKYLMYIQTDKAIYKPGDLVQFRVLFMNSQFKNPKIKKSFEIYITVSILSCM